MIIGLGMSVSLGLGMGFSLGTVMGLGRSIDVQVCI